MKSSQNGKTCNFEKTHPGCLGRMVNLFELNLGVSGNKLLTDKPHRDGSPVSRSRSDVSRISPADQIEDKVTVAEFRNTSSTRKSNGAPMKKLIAHEMSKEGDYGLNPPNLVAKLMGLDSLPLQEPDSAMQRSHIKGRSRSRSEIPMSDREQKNEFFHYVEPNVYKDVYEVHHESHRFAHQGRGSDTTKDKKMALVRQKFLEAKRLSMDEKLRQSKQFHEALEVLSSNKDLFLKCIEPSAMFYQQLHSLKSIPHHLDSKRITVLRPSKIADGNSLDGAGNKEREHLKMGARVQMAALEKSHQESSPPGSRKNCELAEPTRIIVLKPTEGKLRDDKALGSPQSASVHYENFFEDVNVEDNEDKESQEVTNTVTRHVQDKLGRYHRDKALVSPVFSNGYVADESSFDKSEVEFPVDLSDSEVASPVSRHSWDFVNRLGNLYSPSFSRASYSPESSVCREAKKRLSERWAMMASNGNIQEQRHARKSSSTLGEMLAISDAKETTTARPWEEGSSGEGTKKPNSKGTIENVDTLPINLIRSRSVPTSFTPCEARLDADSSVSFKEKIEVPKEDTKQKVKSSLKGKVSSLFFSRNKKTSKDNSPTSETKEQLHSMKSVADKGSVPESSSSGLLDPSSKTSLSNLIFKQSTLSPQTGVPMGRTVVSANNSENQDQPSPISVLDPPFEENEHAAKLFPHYVKADPHASELPLNSSNSNLIDKSPPIGSIPRTLLWDDSSIDTASSYPINESATSQGTEEEKGEWIFYVKTLLSAAGLEGELQSDSLFSKLHSHGSPLDPSLRDKYIDASNKETSHVAKCRKNRSLQKLVFDGVNAALLEISELCQQNREPLENRSLDEEVCAQTSTWFCSERCGLGYSGDGNSLEVERVVQNEVVGNWWTEKLGVEMDNVGMEIAGNLLEELVQEAIVELAGTA